MRIKSDRIELEFYAGTNLKDAAKDAIDFAKQNSVSAFFEFNGCLLEATRASTVEQITSRYEAYCEYERLKYALGKTVVKE